MTESSSSAGPSSQPAPVERSARLESDSTDDLDLERGSARQSVHQSSSNSQDASEPSDFFHLFKEDKNPAKIAQMPPGWPRIAAEQNNYYNQRTHRRFGTLGQKLLTCAQRDLNAAEDEIDELLYGPDGEKRFTLRDPLFAETVDFYLKMGNVLLMDSKLRELPAANVDQHYRAYEHLRVIHGLSEASSAYMLRFEDMVQPKTDLSDVVLNSIVNSLKENRARSWTKKLVYFFFSYSGRKDDKSSNHIDKSLQSINNSRLKTFISIAMLLGGEFVLLAPVLVLYLVPMEKGPTAGAVVAFAFVLTPLIYFSRFTRFAEAVIGLVGFLAVVVAFLAQLGSGPCGCP